MPPSHFQQDAILNRLFLDLPSKSVLSTTCIVHQLQLSILQMYNFVLLNSSITYSTTMSLFKTSKIFVELKPISPVTLLNLSIEFTDNLVLYFTHSLSNILFSHDRANTQWWERYPLSCCYTIKTCVLKIFSKYSSYNNPTACSSSVIRYLF